MIKIIFLCIVIFLSSLGLADVSLYIKRKIYGKHKNFAMAAFIPVKCEYPLSSTSKIVRSTMESFCTPENSLVFLVCDETDNELLDEYRNFFDADFIIPPSQKGFDFVSATLKSIINP